MCLRHALSARGENLLQWKKCVTMEQMADAITSIEHSHYDNDIIIFLS